MSKTISDFVKTSVELGITKDDFIKKFGEPYSINKEIDEKGDYQEVLFYKEQLYIEKLGISSQPHLSLLMANWKSRKS